MHVLHNCTKALASHMKMHISKHIASRITVCHFQFHDVSSPLPSFILSRLLMAGSLWSPTPTVALWNTSWG